MEWTYKNSKGHETIFTSEQMPAELAVSIAVDLEKTGRSKAIRFVDPFDSSWTVKEMKTYLKGIETEPHHVLVYMDGGYNRDEKKAGLGCVIYYEQDGKAYRRRVNQQLDQLTSNNETEYAALFFSMQELERLGVHHLPVRFLSDSRIVINVMNNEWALMEEALTLWANRIEEKATTLGIQAEYELIPRKANSEADQLATQALKGISIAATSEMVS